MKQACDVDFSYFSILKYHVNIYMDLYGVFGVDVVGPSSFFRIRKSQEPLRSDPLGLGRAGGCYDLLGSGGNLENSDDLDGGALDWGKSTVFNEGKWTRTFQDS